MPLRAVDAQGHSVVSCLISDQEWERIHTTNGRHGLRMPDNGAPAIARVSKLGTRHFAHAAGSGANALESAEHLALKTIVCRAAAGAGWHVIPEATGRTQDGEAWRADALCTSKGGRARIAFEIQLSDQPNEETLERQARYDRSGVRALWLVKQGRMAEWRYSYRSMLQDLAYSRACPTFALVWEDVNAAWVNVVGPELPEQRIPVSTFVAGALNGTLKYRDFKAACIQGESIPATVGVWRGRQWWNCQARFDLPYRIYLGRYATEGMDAGPHWEILKAQLDARKRTWPQLARVEFRFSQTIGRKRLTGVCPQCNKIQGSGYIPSYRDRPSGQIPVQIPLSLELAKHLAIELDGWWTWNGE